MLGTENEECFSVGTGEEEEDERCWAHPLPFPLAFLYIDSPVDSGAAASAADRVASAKKRNLW